MKYDVVIDGTRHYYKVLPEDPIQGDIYAIEDEGYIKAYIFNDDEWMYVTNMSPIDKTRVSIQCTDDDSEQSEQLEQLDYQYRIGAI